MIATEAATLGALEVLHPGMGTTVQDAGRVGLRHQGLPRSGWLDPDLAQCAHDLVDNRGDEALLELRGAATVLRVQHGPLRLALVGAIEGQAHLPSDDQAVPLNAWCSQCWPTGTRLTLGLARSGCAYLAVAGGIALPAQLGSRSSYPRAGLSGVLGRALAIGDRLPCRVSAPGPQWCLPPCPPKVSGPLRVIPGPQDDRFSVADLQRFFRQTWQVGPAQDRMGIRLTGTEALHPLHDEGMTMVSDGVATGSVQVPIDGQPILLLADSQTVGGYPKIATVIRADLPRLAHLPPGSSCGFAPVSLDQAAQALQQRQQAWAQFRRLRQRPNQSSVPDSVTLLQHNLVSGLWRAEL